MTQPTRVDTMDEAIVIDCDLEQSPELVWQALTDPDLVAEWLGPISQSSERDASFSVQLEPGEGGPVKCKILEAIPHERLSYAWVGPGPNSAAPLDTIVTFELARTAGNGTHLQVTHDRRDVCLRAPYVILMKHGRTLGQIRPHGRMSGRRVSTWPNQYLRHHRLIATSARRAA